ncbi:hypothetical protein RhiirA1_455475 [Rhizophagus irregularis]|uniref:Uncharacterized protein n=3 Tax=Rhizophagus irregularis TaxID=588596 RepID=U9V4D4_RHIID|nr:hypothetical protein GLOIN_2v1837659 [Rhizophagus irregularis DAOM 181602=DAOM 197198]EXX51880.1 hypothetical protein RirG_257870 [Rhizophagus irregularis DAOM 197198w]PKC69863.1 hypothetical protein RhiirA1_455475 [Rhizophagus irregularis]PKY20217.1 hypothetical protein RhiirB3_433461 [Rhizophagus irregularis]POG77243.1 hypothetical protein GLOIN_2v1837659 [Rhizophagus irregularis DAOM 181602=DAOM 197198]UZO06975.1 hypothetical protein OCT59_027279 [Rhizophagus irregularis]|eukprot:XP_025184109.1 hypothetical protein GLOIN_2v1837659 [Rhizophagus irregularis DAOM 181602=DAOM 197198]
MTSNNQTAQDYSNLSMGDSNEQNNPINNVGAFINSATPAPQNVTFEFYFPFPSSIDTRIYHVTYQYTELHPLENARRLNNSISLSHIPDHQFPLHNNIHSLIQQQIQQLVQQPVYQQNTIQPQLYDCIQPTSQVYSNNNTYDTTSISVNVDNVQDEELQNSP